MNVAATSEPVVRGIPGDSDGSTLAVKLEARQSAGERNIRNWIAQRAADNGSATAVRRRARREL